MDTDALPSTSLVNIRIVTFMDKVFSAHKNASISKP